MLFSKENYYTSMAQVNQILATYQEIPADNVYLTAHNTTANPTGQSALQSLASAVRKPSDESTFLGLQEKKLQMVQSKAEVTKAEYEKALSKFNATVDMFETHYKPVMTRI